MAFLKTLRLVLLGHAGGSSVCLEQEAAWSAGAAHTWHRTPAADADVCLVGTGSSHSRKGHGTDVPLVQGLASFRGRITA